VLLARIQAYIEANLGDPALSPSGIAAHHNISRRYLYRLLEGTGESVRDFMRRRRLERCRAALADPWQNIRGVSEIAFAWGFNDASHFSHVFSKAYGTSPREYRRAAQR
jgi:AraC-like DNA-binding protein